MATILVVDDYDLFRNLLCRILEDSGHSVLTAANGAEALKVATMCLPDLILMDLYMPVMSGWEATRRLRQEPMTAHLPIIAVTVMDEHSAEWTSALHAGCNACLVKPANIPQLVSLVRLYLDRQLLAPRPDAVADKVVALA